MAENISARERKKRQKEIKKARKAELRREQGKLPLGERTAVLSERFGGYDYLLAAAVVLFSIFGVAMVFSAGYYQTINIAEPQPLYYLFRQLFFVVTGWILLFGLANFDYHHYTKFTYVALLFSIGFLVLVLLIGSSSHNAQRWISVFGVRITPSEFSKLFIIVFTATFLIEDPRNIKSFKGLFVLFAAMGAHFALIVRQPNLSTAIVIVMIIFSIMIVAGLNLVFMILPIIAAVGGYFYIITFKTPYHWYQRLTSFVDPFADRQDRKSVV